MKAFALAVCAAVFPVTASANYISTKAQWDLMDGSERANYVAGFMDGFLTQIVGDDKSNVYRSDMGQCLFDLELRSDMLVELIAKGYEDIARWSEAPSQILISGLHQVCLPKLNQYRTGRGEATLPAATAD